MENRLIHRRVLPGMLCALLFIAGSAAAAAPPWASFGDNTRYMALGDSLSAGYGARPATLGFTFRVYYSGVVDNLNNTLFCAAAVPGATSIDVLSYQIPQVQLFFKETGTAYRKVVTLTVGGNDLYSVVKPDGSVDLAAIPGMLQGYGGNLYGILTALTAMSSDVKVYVGNLYDPKIPIPGSGDLIIAMNQLMAQTVSAFPGKVVLVDIHKAFQGRYGLLLNERRGVDPTEIHPTDLGYGVMAAAFADAIGKK